MNRLISSNVMLPGPRFKFKLGGHVANTTVKKDELLAVLRENRDKHRAAFLEAQEGYREEAIRLLDERLKQVRDGKKVSIAIAIPEPQDHTRDYDRVIRMVEMNVETEIKLQEDEFENYVMDRWSWSRTMAISNSRYTKSEGSQAYFASFDS